MPVKMLRLSQLGKGDNAVVHKMVSLQIIHDLGKGSNGYII